jgi:hypothetical protein
MGLTARLIKPCLQASLIFFLFWYFFGCAQESMTQLKKCLRVSFLGGIFIFILFFLLCPGEYDAAEDILASLIFSSSPGSARRGADTGIQNSEKSHLWLTFDICLEKPSI